MTQSSRTTVAIHVLSLLAFCGPEPCTSEFIGGSVNTNPVVIRRLLASLREAGLVGSQAGPGGGWHLLGAPEAITLAQIFLAVEDGSLFPLHAAAPNPLCPVGRNIQAALTGIYQDAERALVDQLARTTLAELVRDVKTLAS